MSNWQGLHEVGKVVYAAGQQVKSCYGILQCRVAILELTHVNYAIELDANSEWQIDVVVSLAQPTNKHQSVVELPFGDNLLLWGRSPIIHTSPTAGPAQRYRMDRYYRDSEGVVDIVVREFCPVESTGYKVNP